MAFREMALQIKNGSSIKKMALQKNGSSKK
jgi:hypothetical protein